MFPITHIWFSREVLGTINNMTVLGSVFPDTVISGYLTHEQTHKVGWGIYGFFEHSYPVHFDFVRGLVTHTINPRGLDFYADQEYGRGLMGYCFQKAQDIEKEVIAACNIPESYGLWKAHNFIEMGIELNVAEEERELVNRLHEALNDYELINELSVPLEKYFGIKKLLIQEYMKRFSGFVELENLNSITLAYKYDKQMNVKHGISIDTEKCSKIIEKSRVIVKSDFSEFAKFCIKEVSNMLGREKE